MVELAADKIEFRIGQRVESGGHRGTITYIGPVAPTEGSWLGIDWDDPSRGKHDGVYQEVRYFTAKHPTSGSFVRQEKVNAGRSCADGIKLRYGASEPNLENLEERLLQVKKSFNAPFLEMVGFDEVNKKLSCFESLQIVWLHDYCINGAGEPQELQNICPNIEELDLSKNLLSDWRDVVDIGCQLCHLRLLNLSENALNLPSNFDDLQKLNAFPQLKYLILSQVHYTWDDIINCAPIWPNVEHLQVPFNNITSLGTPPKSILENVKYLDLSENNIEHWEEINTLGMLPLLETLNVSNTGLCDIVLPVEKNLFRSLRQLLVSHNKIRDWADVSQLDNLKLEELKFRDNPVLNEFNIETYHQIIIARIGSLKMLNGQDINRDERKGAEYDYIKRYGQQWQDAQLNSQVKDKFLRAHPRYPTLISKYGEAESSEYKEVSTKLKSTLLGLEIVAKPNGQKVTKRLPHSMLVQRLVGLVQKIFNTGFVVPTLSVISPKNQELKVPLDNHLKSLDFYSIENGDTILVEW